MPLELVSSPTTDNPFDGIAADLVKVQQEIGEEIVARTQDRCSIDVEYIGNHIVRSKPGENPRRETGKLWGSFESETNIDGEIVRTVIDTDVFYATELQELRDRPIFDGLLDEYEPLILDRIAETIGG